VSNARALYDKACQAGLEKACTAAQRLASR